MEEQTWWMGEVEIQCLVTLVGGLGLPMLIRMGSDGCWRPIESQIKTRTITLNRRMAQVARSSVKLTTSADAKPGPSSICTSIWGSLRRYMRPNGTSSSEYKNHVVVGRHVASLIRSTLRNSGQSQHWLGGVTLSVSSGEVSLAKGKTSLVRLQQRQCQLCCLGGVVQGIMGHATIEGDAVVVARFPESQIFRETELSSGKMS